MSAKEPTVERRHREQAFHLKGATEEDVARALAAAEQTSAERAWDEGYEAAGKVVHPGVNPYRKPKWPTK